MSALSKGVLLFNTVKYLKPVQLINQLAIRIKPKEQFWKYEKKYIETIDLNLWIDGLDNDLVFLDRYKPEKLICDKLTLLNETIVIGEWNYPTSSHLLNFNIHYLEYLIPLYSIWKSSGDEKYKNKINEIMLSWYKKGSLLPDSNQPYVISLRIINQLIVSDVVEDKQRLYDSIYAQYKYLIKHQEKHLLGNHYFENLKAIVICSVIFNEDKNYKYYIKKLISELKEEITDDGLHFELSLMYHKIVLEDLIRVAVILKQAKKCEYMTIVEYIYKMCTALYSIEDGINRTPLFNDAGDNVAKSKDALLKVCKELFCIELEKKECISGYYKIRDGNVAVIFDCANLAPSYMPGHAHCDCLSFELFYKGKPVFVNLGTYQYQGDRRKSFRSTASHNTVMINGHEQSELWGEHRAGRRIRKIRHKREPNCIIGSYENYLGERHCRKMYFAKGLFEVSDKISGDGRSYLHLAPGLRYEADRIIGTDINITIDPINCKLTTQNMPYSECFGRYEQTECIVFSWSKDNEKHGYKIKIEEI